MAGMDLEHLIVEVRERKCLYAVKEAAYRDTIKKGKAWEEVAEALGRSVTDCKTRWRSTKDRYRKEKRRESEATRSGAAAGGYRAWKFMEVLKFLDEHVDFRTTSSNIDEDVTLVVLQDGNNVQMSGEADNLPNMNTSCTTSASDKDALTKATDLDETIMSLVNKESDDAEKFALSLVDTLRRLPVQRLQLAKIKIHELLYNIEFGEI
uniref:uncharacterized protein LOC120336973 n=2 Tax=Styela clava TaxID=7725 RepID=UPI0019396973|nr:uncharacterized protein LOC120336973 [Styela clava]XP_039263828.1 uncharacterized protein LOC120339708 [Styela clava]